MDRRDILERWVRFVATSSWQTSFLRSLFGLVRIYTRCFPLRRGKYRLIMLLAPYINHLPRESVVSTRDGRRFSIDWSTGMADTIYFLGEYERAVSAVVERLVRPGDVCLDVGASIGWYTTLLRSLCGLEGEVHAFEPLPKSYAHLENNVRLAGAPANVFLNHTALGDATAPVTVHVFDGFPDGHASLSTMGRSDRSSIEVPMRTLDSYLAERNTQGVAFVKLDVEGAELMFLRGASRLFEQRQPPIFIIEMALDTTAGFGYLPDDLIRFLSEQRGYRFFAIDEVACDLCLIDGFGPEDPGAYVLCVPDELPGHRLEGLRIRA